MSDHWNTPEATLERAEDDVDRVAQVEYRKALRRAISERNEAIAALRAFFDAGKNSVPYRVWSREMHEANRILEKHS
jgi:hypothetical protein